MERTRSYEMKSWSGAGRRTPGNAPAPRNEDHRLMGSLVLSVGLLAMAATTAHARPEPIQPPVEEPAPEESPGTGQDAPEDPADPPPIEPPGGLACTAAANQSDCDPAHPGGPEGKRPGNKPPRGWYKDMAKQMYELQGDLQQLSTWGKSHDPLVHYYATWMTSVVQQYYALGFHANGSPRSYSYGPMTRGDFNYYYYYWVQPIYYSLLYYSAQYYSAHTSSPQIPYYRSYLSNVASSYHDLVACNYGFNGDDEGAREDMKAKRREAQAGLRR